MSAALMPLVRETVAVGPENGRQEVKAANNHGTFYDLQLADFALFSHREAFAKKLLAESREKRIAAQIDPDGRQPLEKTPRTFQA